MPYLPRWLGRGGGQEGQVRDGKCSSYSSTCFAHMSIGLVLFAVQRDQVSGGGMG